MNDKFDRWVTFNGVPYFLVNDSSGGAALAPQEHMTPDNQIKVEHIFSESFAHLKSNGEIIRYREKIRTVDDLINLNDTDHQRFGIESKKQ